MSVFTEVILPVYVSGATLLVLFGLAMYIWPGTTEDYRKVKFSITSDEIRQTGARSVLLGLVWPLAVLFYLGVFAVHLWRIAWGKDG